MAAEKWIMDSKGKWLLGWGIFLTTGLAWSTMNFVADVLESVRNAGWGSAVWYIILSAAFAFLTVDSGTTTFRIQDKRAKLMSEKQEKARDG